MDFHLKMSRAPENKRAVKIQCIFQVMRIKPACYILPWDEGTRGGAALLQGNEEPKAKIKKRETTLKV